MQIADVKEGEIINDLLQTLYEMFRDDQTSVAPGDNGGIVFENQWHSIEVLDDGLYCNHKTIERESQDYPGPTPDHADTTRYFDWCDSCKTEIEGEEPDHE